MSKITCNICRKEISHFSLRYHLKSQHKLSVVEYKKKNNDINVVVCYECNKEIGAKAIGTHVREKHNMSYADEYIPKWFDKYPNTFSNWNRCRICNKLVKGHLTCSKECDSDWKSETYKGRKGHSFTEKQKQKISKTNKMLIKKLGHGFTIGYKHTVKTRRVLSDFAKTRTGKKNSMFGKTHTPEAVKKIFSHRPMNKLEKRVADMLDRNNIKYHFQFFIVENKICKSYDFKIKRKPIIIEVDGDFWHGNPKLKTHWKDVKKVRKNDKLKAKLAKTRGYEVIRFWENDIKKSPDLIEEQIKNI